MPEENRSGALYAQPSIVYLNMQETLLRMRDVYGGNKTLREAGTKYLPMFLEEENKEYRARIKTLTIPNYLKEAIGGYVGRIFAKPTTPGDDFDDDMKVWWEDLDRIGSKADVFFRNVVTAGIRDGICWVLVDMPRSTATNLREEREQNIRPYCRKYDALDVLFVEADEMGRIVDFRVRESRYQTVDYVQREVKIVRRYTPGKCEIYNESTGEVQEFQISFPAERGVPVVPYIAASDVGTGYYVESPMLDLADLSIRLWNSQAEQDNCLHIARCPILFARGWRPTTENQNIVVTSMHAYCSDEANASLQWVEHSGSALNTGKDDIETLKREIQAVGLKPLLNTDGGSRTATEVESDEARATSPLRNMADNAQDMIENVLKYMAIWSGKEDGPSIALNSNFELAAYDANAITTLISMKGEGLVTKQTILKEAQRRGLISDDVDIVRELEAANAEDHAESHGEDEE